MPSLKQLNEAVLAYIEDHPTELVTVVVDATFGHRIDPREVPEYDEAIENNELVCPPAGAIGRGDAFVLTIANKANAVILSNDSFQEFHPDYPWLFDEGRLIGGKPVPNVGWVFVNRAPVRGPVSRRATKEKKGRAPARERVGVRASAMAFEPMPTPKSPPPRRAAAAATSNAAEPAVLDPIETPLPSKRSSRPPRARRAEPAKGAQAPAAAKNAMVNELGPFLAFVEHHPVGSQVEATIESYSSHGAYARSGDTRCYVPMRYMATPMPRAAREIVALGETLTFTVVSFNAARRGIDMAIPGFEPATAVTSAVRDGPAKRPARRGRVARPTEAAVEPDLRPVGTPIEQAPTKTTRRRAAKAAPVEAVVDEPVSAAARARRRPAKKAAEPVAETVASTPRKSSRQPAKASATTPAPLPTPVKKVAAKRARASVKTAAPLAAPVETAPTKQAPVEKAATVKKAPVKKVAAKKATAKKAAAKKVPAAKKVAKAKPSG